jgi:hypothetical protein
MGYERSLFQSLLIIPMVIRGKSIHDTLGRGQEVERTVPHTHSAGGTDRSLSDGEGSGGKLDEYVRIPTGEVPPGASGESDPGHCFFYCIHTAQRDEIQVGGQVPAIRVDRHDGTAREDCLDTPVMQMPADLGGQFGYPGSP